MKAVTSWIEADDSETVLMTYEFQDVSTEPIVSEHASVGSKAPYDVRFSDVVQPEKEFELPEQWTHDTCARNQAGFPYLHVLHHYVRF